MVLSGVRRWLCVFGAAIAAQYAFSQQLSLQDALALAHERNGDVRAAEINYKIALSRVRSARAGYYPSITPRFSYDTNKTKNYTGSSLLDSGFAGDSSSVTASWRLLDSGVRRLTLKSAENSADSTELGTLNILRNTLFAVHSRFFDAVRAQELLKVQMAQQKRAEEILEETKFRIQVGDQAKKDELQAEADLLNARASVLGAQVRVDSTEAALKAIIGWGKDKSLPELVQPTVADGSDLPISLEQAFEEGLKVRPDVLIQKLNIQAQKLEVSQARLDAGVQYTLDASYVRSFSPGVQDRSGLVFEATIPLFDGGATRERVTQAKLGVDTEVATMEQVERDARADIESAFKTYLQNKLRVEATQLALKASQQNYEVALASDKAGAGTLLEVITAQVSLVTAESNAVEAAYDLLISDAQLRLSIGRAIPGQ